MKRLVRLSSPLLALVFVVSGCREAKVTAYRAAKDAEPSLPASPAEHATPEASAPPSPSNSAGPALATATGAGLTWSAPADWQVKSASAMRKGSYTVGGKSGDAADLSITAFPGAVGGELANLNRWRGQLSLPPLDESALESAVTRIAANDLVFTVVDLVSTDSPPRRILGAMVPHEGAMWFFKLTGSDAALSGVKPPFLAFLKTVKTAPTATP